MANGSGAVFHHPPAEVEMPPQVCVVQPIEASEREDHRQRDDGIQAGGAGAGKIRAGEIVPGETIG